MHTPSVDNGNETKIFEGRDSHFNYAGKCHESGVYIHIVQSAQYRNMHAH